jgi:hypothetical protein
MRSSFGGDPTWGELSCIYGVFAKASRVLSCGKASRRLGVEATRVATWRDVKRIALALLNAYEQQRAEGKRAWLVDDKFFAWERPLRRSDIAALGDRAPAGPILGVRTDGLEMKEALLARNPHVYFTTPHFDGYPAVLIELGKIALKELEDVVVEAWLARAPKRVVAQYLHGARQARGGLFARKEFTRGRNDTSGEKRFHG